MMVLQISGFFEVNIAESLLPQHFNREIHNRGMLP